MTETKSKQSHNKETESDENLPMKKTLKADGGTGDLHQPFKEQQSYSKLLQTVGGNTGRHIL